MRANTFDKGLLTYDKLFMTSNHYTFSQLVDQIKYLPPLYKKIEETPI